MEDYLVGIDMLAAPELREKLLRVCNELKDTREQCNALRSLYTETDASNKVFKQKISEHGMDPDEICPLSPTLRNAAQGKGVGRGNRCPYCDRQMGTEMVAAEVMTTTVREKDAEIARLKEQIESMRTLHEENMRDLITRAQIQGEKLMDADSLMSQSMRVHSDADLNTLSPQEMRDKLRSIQTVNDNLVKSVASRHESVTNLLSAKESAMNGLDGLRHTNTSLVGEVNKLQDAGQAADDEVVELKRSLRDKTAALSRMIKVLATKERTINKLRDSLGNSKLSGDGKFQPEIDSLNNEIKELRKQVQTCTEVERPALRRRIANLADTIAELQRQLQDESNGNVVFKRSAAGPIDTSEELREARERIKLIERLIAENSNKDNAEDFEKARKELLARIDELTKSESEYREKLHDVQRQLMDKAEKVRQLSDELDKRPMGEDEKARLRYLEHLVASQENAALASADDASKEKIKHLQEQIEEKTREIDALTAKNSWELREKEDQILENMSKINALRDELERAKSAAMDANARIRYLEHLYSTLSDLTATATGTGTNLEDRIRALNANNTEKEENINTLTSRLQSNDDRLRELEQRLLHEQQGKEQLSEQLSELQEEYKALSDQLRKKEAEIEDKIMQINTLSPQLDEARYRIKRLEKEYTVLKSTHIHSSELDPYRQQLAEKEVKIDELNKELRALQELQANGEQAHSELMRDFQVLTDTAEKRDKELVEKDLTIDRLLDAIRVQEESFTKLRMSVMCMEDEQKTSEMASKYQKECLEELAKARDELEAQVQKLTKGIDKARTGESEARKHVDEVMKNNRVLCEKLNNEIEELTRQLNSKPNVDPAVLTMLKEAQQRIKTLEARPLIPEEVERELAFLREQINNSGQSELDVSELARKLKELEQLLEERNKEIEQLKREIREKDGKISELEARILASQQVIESLNSLTADAAQKIRVLEDELCSQFVSGAPLASMHSLEETIDELRKHYGEAVDKLLQTKAENSSDLEELAKLRTMSNSDEIERLRERLNIKEKEVETLKPLLEEAQARVRVFESTHAEKIQELAQAQQELANIKEDLHNTQNELERLRHNQHDNVDTEREYEWHALEESAAALRRDLDMKEHEIEALKKEIEDVNVEELRAELRNKEEEIRRLEERLATRSPSTVSGTARDSTALGTQLELLEQNRKLKEEVDSLLARIIEAEKVNQALRAAGNTGKNVSDDIAHKEAELAELRANLSEAQKRLAAVETAYARHHSQNDKDAEIKTLTETLAQQSQAMAALREANMAKDREIDELNDALIYQERTVTSLCASLSPRMAVKSPMRSVMGPMSPPMQPLMSSDAASEISNLRAALERANETISSLEKANTSTSKQVQDLQTTMESKEKECEKLLATIQSMSRDETINAPEEGGVPGGADPAELAALKKELEVSRKELSRLKMLHHYRSRADEGALEDILDKDMQIEEFLEIIERLNASNDALEKANTAKDEELKALKEARFYNESEMTGMREQTMSQTGEVHSMEASLKDSERTIMGLCAALSPDLTAKAYIRDLDEVDPSLYAILKAECMRLNQCLDFSKLPPDAKEVEFKSMLEKVDRLQAELLRKDDALKNGHLTGGERDAAYLESLEERLREYDQGVNSLPKAARDKLMAVKLQMEEWFRERPSKGDVPTLLEIFN